MWVCIVYTGSAVNMYVQFGRHVCLEVYANNVKCIYISAFGHIIDGLQLYVI